MYQIDIQEHRSNADKCINNYGKRLIELCISLGMFIANGRVGADAKHGKVTCKDVSLVDYVICSSELLHVVLCKRL